MRYYGFGNYYLSSIQQGIQAAHCIADMFVKYELQPSLNCQWMLGEWAKNHKTMVLLNGGNSDGLKYLADHFNTTELPWARFQEDTQSLNNALTHVGIIVPELVYELGSYLRNCGTNVQDVIDQGGYETFKQTTAGQMRVFFKITEVEARLATVLNRYQLAR
jgi:hypothetical protein